MSLQAPPSYDLFTDEPPTAREWRREALTIAVACGAHRARQRLEPTLGTPSAAPDSALGLLSPAERRVALFVADGLTNHQVAQQLHLSRHTVDSHLRKIFAKWDIQSRVALAKVVAGGRENHGKT